MSKNDQQDEFKPKGTITVLVIFVITLLALWGSVYLILLSRGITI
jgi:hypothetical protein